MILNKSDMVRTKFQKLTLEYAEKYKLLMNKTTVAQNIVDIYKKNKP